MSYHTHSNRVGSRQGGLLGIVIGLHAGLFALFMVGKTALPHVMEAPLIVDLIESSVAKPAPILQKPVTITPPKPVNTPSRKITQPAFETTASAEPTPSNAPMASPSEAKPTHSVSSASSKANGETHLVQARFDADYLKNPAPPYPPASRRFGEEGKVILRVRVSSEGGAEQVEIKASSGSVRLDESAQKTVRNWKFITAQRGGTAIESWVLVPIMFRLEE